MATDYMNKRRLLDRLDRQSAHFANCAMTRLANEKMRPHPENYTLWYTYYAGHLPDLNRAIDGLGESRQALTPSRFEELVNNFFRSDGESKTVRDINAKMQEAIGELLKTVKDNLAEIGVHIGTVEHFNRSLDADMNIESLRQMVGHVVSETRNIINNQHVLRSKLDVASRELASLRANLASVQRQAETDAMTGIANRRGFDRAITAAVAESRNDNSHLSLILIDIDNFKKFNDSFGHPIGDQVIKLVASLLAKLTAEKGIVARFGGEEFAIILPRCECRETKIFAENVRQTMASSKISNREGGPNFGTVTLSLGVAKYLPEESVAELIERTDAALYQAKQQGRNRVSIA